jgi:ADP-L-glycero-D-manno-heptose 6-epimerase
MSTGRSWSFFVKKKNTILVTGAGGFIGSTLVWELNQKGYDRIICVDRWDERPKWQNLAKRKFLDILGHHTLWDFLNHHGSSVATVFHLGAISYTTEKNMGNLIENNIAYSQKLFDFCTEADIPFYYASSAATYGNGEKGYSDDPKLIQDLRPINPYGLSKHWFDRWVLQQRKAPSFWAGFKFFNVYGPGEFHKIGMESVVLKAFREIKETGKVKLFRSHREGIAHGEQKRDFIYVKDITAVLTGLIDTPPKEAGIYNLGTGKARSFLDLVQEVFHNMNCTPAIEWIDMPPNILNQYQYFTQATMDRFKENISDPKGFSSLEEGIKDYLKSYLFTDDPYL